MKLLVRMVAVAIGSLGWSGCGEVGARSGSAGADTGPADGDAQGGPAAMGVLATGQHSPSGLAVDETNVYWINVGDLPPNPGGKPTGPYTGGQVMKCAIGGCDNNPTTLASGRQQGLSLGSPLPIALDAINVYWNDWTPLAGDPSLTHLFKCAIGGCDNAPTAVAPGLAFALAVDGGSAYWTDPYESQITTCSTDGCASPTALTLLPSNALPTGIAVDATSLYWTLQLGGITKCAVDGCSPSLTTLATGLTDPNPGITPPGGGTATAVSILGQIAVDDTNVYVVDRNAFGLGRILKCAKNGCNGSPTTLASGLSGAVGIAADGNAVYWTEAGDGDVAAESGAGPGRVAKCAIAGCGNSPAVIAANQNAPGGIAVDATHVYWTTGGISATDGTINMAMK